MRSSKVVGTFLLIVGTIAFVGSFALGVLPGIHYEQDGYLDASRRCPPVAPEDTFDAECTARLVARGPLYLGREALVASFLCGGLAIFGFWLVLPGGRSKLALTLVVVAYLLTWGLLLAWNAREGERLARDGAQVVGLAFLIPD